MMFDEMTKFMTSSTRVIKHVPVKELEKFDFYLIGDRDRELYYPAIIGLAKDKSHIAYSFHKLVDCFVLNNHWTVQEAIEWVEFNVVRALPYYGEKAPVILDRWFINRRNRKYDPIEICA